jgi:transcriptional regulator with XRE-family HTH domain
MSAGGKTVWVHPDEQRTVGDVLSKARQQRGLNQRDVADRLGKPQSFVSAYEAGQRRVDVIEFLRISAAIGDDAEGLFREIARLHVAGRQK